MDFLFCFSFLCSLLLSCNAVEDEVIIEVTNRTFDSFIEGEDMVIIEFYASWCVYCHELEPTFEEIAKNLKPHDIKFGKVDIEEEIPLKQRFSVTQLPDVRIFRRGIMYKYAGPLGASGAEEITKYFLKEKEKDHLGENPILTLTDANFDEITSTAEVILVNFFVTQCLKCKRLEPIFTAAARKLSKHTPPILFGTVDVPKNMDTAKQVGFDNYPQLRMFRYGKMYEYTGEETEDGMVSYMKRQAGPPSLFLEDLAAVKKFINSPDEVVAVGFFSPSTSATVIDSFIESGNFVRQDIRLGHTTDSTIAEKLKFDINSVIVYHPKKLVSKYEKGYSEIPNIEQETSEDLKLTLTQAAKPLVGQVTIENFGSLYTHRPLLVAYYDVNWHRDSVEDTKYWHALIADVAKKFRSTEVEFAIGQEHEFPQDLKALGLSDWGEDFAVGLFAPGPLKYRMTEELTRDSLTEFVEGFLEETLTPYYMSEPAPKKGKGPVRTIVGSTFSKIVYDSSKNVVLKICIPVISTCQEAEEWFFRAANKYKLKDLVFGEINVELNDIPLVETKFDELPAFLFSPKGSKGESDLVVINPVPEDDRDLTMWLRQEFNIKTNNKTPKSEL